MENKRLEMKFDENGNIVWHKSKKLSVINEGNIAFKCTYNDNGYRKVCNNNIYRYNTRIGRIWCVDPQNDCRKFEGKQILENDYPCYESCLFLNWQFGTGIKRGKKYHGTHISLKKANRGKLAFLTTREPIQFEKDRIIFGFIFINDIVNIPDPEGIKEDANALEFIIGDKEKSLAIHPEIKLKFWDYYKNPDNQNTLFWNSDLFTYVSDFTAVNILKDLRQKYNGKNDDAAIKILDNHIAKYTDE